MREKNIRGRERQKDSVVREGLRERGKREKNTLFRSQFSKNAKVQGVKNVIPVPPYKKKYTRIPKHS